MTSGFLQLAVFSLVLFLVQALAALPWLYVLTGRPARQQGAVFGIFLVLGLIFAFMSDMYSDPAVLARLGRLYMSALHVQLALDLFVVVFWLLLRFWPKGGAVALAAFQEG